jgi:hypothetical protein
MSDYIVNPQSLCSSDDSSSSSGSSGTTVTSGLTYDGSTLNCIMFNQGNGLNANLQSLNKLICSMRDDDKVINNLIQNTNEQVAELTASVANLSTNDISLEGFTPNCISITPNDVLSTFLDKLEEKVCSIESSVGGIICPDDGAGSGSSTYLYKKYYSKSFVHNVSNKFDLSNFGLGVVTVEAGSTTDENGCTQATAGSILDITSETYQNREIYLRNKKGVGLKYYIVAQGSAEPTLVTDETPLFKLSANNAGTLSMVTDQREYTPFDQTIFRSDTDLTQYIASGSITGSQLDLTAKLTYSAAHTLSDPKDIAHKSYVDAAVAALPAGIWTPEASPATGIGFANAVGIGTLTPTGATLHVQGTVKIADGTEAAGKYFVCDANGVGSWTTAGFANVAYQDEGVALNPTNNPSRIETINFVGAGVTTAFATSTDQSNGKLTVTIASGGASAFDDLSNVSVAGASAFDTLRYNGTSWLSSNTLINTGQRVAIGNPSTVDAILHVNAGDIPVLKLESAAGQIADISATGILTYQKQFKYTYTNGGANPLGANKVLTSDAAGNAVWSDASNPTLSQVLTAGAIAAHGADVQLGTSLGTGTATLSLAAATAIAELKSQNSGVSEAKIGFNTNSGTMRYQDLVTSANYSDVTVNANEAQIGLHKSAGKKEIELKDDGGSSIAMLVTDSIRSKGLEYAAAYKGNFTTYSLVDKDYVDTTITNLIGSYIEDSDFSSNGIMLRTGAGAYSVVADSSSNWNTAYGWGDHSAAGYAEVGSYQSGYIPRWNSTTNTLDKSILQDDGTNVGVGTAPVTAKKLTVGGSVLINGSLKVASSSDGKVDLNNYLHPTNGEQHSNYINWNNSDGTRKGYVGFTDINTFNINVQQSTGTSQIVLDADEIIFNSVGGTDSSNITTGVWQATAIADAYIASAATWNAKASISATPANQEVAVWTNGTTVKGDTHFKWTGAQIEVTDADNNKTEVRADWLRVYNETADANLFLYGYGTSGSNNHRGEIVLGAANGTRGGETATVNTDTIANIYAFGHNGTSFKQGGQLLFQATENYTSTASGTKFVIQTAKNGTNTIATRYTIDGDGNHSFVGDVKYSQQVYQDGGIYNAGSTGASFTPNFINGNLQKITMSNASITIANPTNVQDGATYTIGFVQDATGGRTIATWGSNINWGDAGAPDFSSGAATKKHYVTFIVNGTTLDAIYSGVIH